MNQNPSLADRLSDHIRAAYIAGATDVHNHWSDDEHPEFTEAAHDYEASVRPLLLEAAERLEAHDDETRRLETAVLEAAMSDKLDDAGSPLSWRERALAAERLEAGTWQPGDIDMGELLCDSWQDANRPDNPDHAVFWDDFGDDQKAMWRRAAERFATHWQPLPPTPAPGGGER